MPKTLHITNGDSAKPGIRTADSRGDVLPWRDVLHEGPVPAGVSLADLSRIRAKHLAQQGMGNSADLEKSFRERDDRLRRFTDHDEVVLWFEWDLYDQLQLIQILDFIASHSEDLVENGTVLSIVSLAGYLGELNHDDFPALFESRRNVTREMLLLGTAAWSAFRSSDPRDFETVARGDCADLEFLRAAIERQLEELPCSQNGLSRSERQILESVSQGPRSFADVFRSTSAREDRRYCGDATLARYIERMSRHQFPLLTHPTGEIIHAPRTADDSRAFRNAEIALAPAGREVLRADRDWIASGGTNRWLGGIHINGRECPWRWDSVKMCVERREVVS